MSIRALESLRKEARRRRVGYQTLINEILALHVRIFGTTSSVPRQSLHTRAER